MAKKQKNTQAARQTAAAAKSRMNSTGRAASGASQVKQRADDVLARLKAAIATAVQDDGIAQSESTQADTAAATARTEYDTAKAAFSAAAQADATATGQLNKAVKSRMPQAVLDTLKAEADKAKTDKGAKYEAASAAATKLNDANKTKAQKAAVLSAAKRKRAALEQQLPAREEAANRASASYEQAAAAASGASVDYASAAAAASGAAANAAQRLTLPRTLVEAVASTKGEVISAAKDIGEAITDIATKLSAPPTNPTAFVSYAAGAQAALDNVSKTISSTFSDAAVKLQTELDAYKQQIGGGRRRRGVATRRHRRSQRGGSRRRRY